MITPEDIKTKVESWYKEFLIATIRSESFFPKDVRFGKIKHSDILENLSRIDLDIQNLRRESKEYKGHGYTIEFIRRNDRSISYQHFPNRISFDTEQDYLKYIHKEKEFLAFKQAVGQITERIPRLYDWLLQNPLEVIKNVGEWDGLLKVCEYFIKNPRPDKYIRELPIGVHTKFIEEKKAIIKHLLDYLIEDYVNRDEDDFEKRFGLKYKEPLIRLRILDEDISRKYFSGLTDISIPQSDINNLNIDPDRVFIIENKTSFSNIFNFLTLPLLRRTMAIFGNGFQLSLLKDTKWLKDKQIIYWGDIDPHGFQMLSQMRSYFPQTQSLMMDFETFNAFQEFVVQGSETIVSHLDNLIPKEDMLFKHLLSTKQNRLEQEKINQAFALMKIETLLNNC